MNLALSKPSHRVRCTSGPMQYTSGYKYQIRTEVRFALPPEFDGVDIAADFITLKNRELVIYVGYAYNGASGPTIDTKNSMRATAFHDAMYQLFCLELLIREFRALVDELFYELLRQDGMAAPRAFVWRRGVQKMGDNPSRANKNIMVAP